MVIKIGRREFTLGAVGLAASVALRLSPARRPERRDRWHAGRRGGRPGQAVRAGHPEHPGRRREPQAHQAHDRVLREGPPGHHRLGVLRDRRRTRRDRAGQAAGRHRQPVDRPGADRQRWSVLGHRAEPVAPRREGLRSAAVEPGQLPRPGRQDAGTGRGLRRRRDLLPLGPAAAVRPGRRDRGPLHARGAPGLGQGAPEQVRLRASGELRPRAAPS